MTVKKDDQRLLTTTDELARFCEEAVKHDTLGVDTEFILEKHYWADLCLIQLATKGTECAVDTKSPNMELDPLFELLKNPKVTKVFHSAREDVLIFNRVAGELPTPLFDTQLAAMFCGYGAQPGYATLVKKVFGKTLDKSQQLTDWSKRPLTPRQIEYSLNDVLYLLELKKRLEKKMDRQGRLKWYRDEFDHYMTRQLHDIDPHERWKRVHIRQPTPLKRSVLREIVAWREFYAREHDVPARWVIADFPLAEIAGNPPRTLTAFNGLRFLPQSFRNNAKGRELFKAVMRGINTPPDDMPEPIETHAANENPGVLQLLSLLLNRVSDEKGIAVALIATQNDLRLFASGGVKHNRIMQGWRKDIFGDLALKLVNGKLAFKVENGKLKLVENGTSRNILGRFRGLYH